MKNINLFILAITSSIFSSTAVAHEGHGSELFGGLFHAFEHPSTWAIMAIAIIVIAKLLGKSSEE